MDVDAPLIGETRTGAASVGQGVGVGEAAATVGVDITAAREKTRVAAINTRHVILGIFFIGFSPFLIIVESS